jgi:hypothetical protein
MKECLPMRRFLVVLVLLVPLLLAARLPYSDKFREVSPNRPDGHWLLRGNELQARDGRMTWKIPVVFTAVTLTADYSVTKDSMCYGIVTKTEYDSVMDAKLKEKLPEVDDTFSFRFRVDDDEMNIRDLRGKGFDQFKNAAGRYKQKPDRVRYKAKGKDAGKDRYPKDK